MTDADILRAQKASSSDPARLEREAQRAEGWQPIDTAPKDGTVVLLCGGHDDGFHHAMAPEQEAFMRAPCRAMWSQDGWLMALAEGCFVGVNYENPTHWMPPPAPPNADRVIVDAIIGEKP